MVGKVEQPPISCLWGTPYQDPVTGEWKCPSDINNPAGPATPTPATNPNRTVRGTPNINIYMPAYQNPYPAITGLPAGSTPAADAPTTIFGLSPLMLGLLAVGGLFVFSSMGDEKPAAHHR